MPYLGLKGNSLFFVHLLCSVLVLHLQKEEEASNHQCQEEHIEGEGGLFHQLIPPLQKGALDSVEIDHADKMLHCLFSHSEIGDFCVSRGLGHKDTLSLAQDTPPTDEEYHEIHGVTFHGNILVGQYRNIGGGPLVGSFDCL